MIEKTDQHYKADSGNIRSKKTYEGSCQYVLNSTIIYIKQKYVGG